MAAAFPLASPASFDRGAFQVLADASPVPSATYQEPPVPMPVTFDLFVMGPLGLISIGVTNLLSVIACVWLLWRFRGLRERTSRVLPVRQLWHLAISDLMYSLCAVVYSILEGLDLWPQTPQTAPAVCDATYFILIIGLYTSVMLEAALALGFAADYWRCKTCLRMLDASLLWVWPLGVILSGIDMMSHMTSEGGHCEMERMVVRQGEAYVIFIGFLVSLVSYGASLYRVHMFPGPVQGLIWRMAWVYPVNFFLTYGLLMIYDVFDFMPETHDLVFLVAYTLEGLNGFVNAVSYASNCRYVKRTVDVRQLWSPSGRPGERLLLAVGAPASDESISGTPESLTCSADEGRLAFLEFHVGFRENLESIIHVPALTNTSSLAGSGVEGSTEALAAKQRRERAQDIVGQMEEQDMKILRISSCLVQLRLKTDKQLPGVPSLDPQQSVTAADVQYLEEIRAHRDSWIYYHEHYLEAAV
eukprot:TRINITY_DN5886_c0_g1_i2.p1 TRINITY_DN5886_c0_g1~~TRINITY_DN5886_c0_g1_i2.p1  ORF type:complete len:473 (+),score=52.60 TRINITY_DN5886_c0_g1_i2:68-1486(+)